MKTSRIIIAVLLSIVTVFYLLPTSVAIARSRTNTASITVLNIFLGWTLIGWVVALSWSVATDRKEKIEIEPRNDLQKSEKKPGGDVWIVVVVVIFFMGVIGFVSTNETDLSTKDTVETSTQESEEEKRERWGKGIFTEKEIIEIKEEEEKENKAVEKIRELEAQGIEPDYEAIWQETRE